MKRYSSNDYANLCYNIIGKVGYVLFIIATLNGHLRSAHRHDRRDDRFPVWSSLFEQLHCVQSHRPGRPNRHCHHPLRASRCPVFFSHSLHASVIVFISSFGLIVLIISIALVILYRNAFSSTLVTDSASTASTSSPPISASRVSRRSSAISVSSSSRSVSPPSSSPKW